MVIYDMCVLCIWCVMKLRRKTYQVMKFSAIIEKHEDVMKQSMLDGLLVVFYIYIGCIIVVD